MQCAHCAVRNWTGLSAPIPNTE